MSQLVRHIGNCSMRKHMTNIGAFGSGLTPIHSRLITNKEVDLITNFGNHNVHPMAIGVKAVGRWTSATSSRAPTNSIGTAQAFEGSIERRDALVTLVLKIGLDG